MRCEAKDLADTAIASRDLEAVPVLGRAAARLKDRMEGSRIKLGEAVDVEQDQAGAARIGLSKDMP
jgi:hypothetical protein